MTKFSVAGDSPDIQLRRHPDLLLRRGPTLAAESDHTVRTKVHRQELTRLRLGAYVKTADIVSSFGEDKHRLLIAATIPHCANNSVVSHVSAAVLHGLPVWGAGLGQVHITKSRPNSGHITKHLHTHCAPLLADEVTTIAGQQVTSVHRTLIDLARTLSFESSVVAADAALHEGLVSISDLTESLGRARRRRGASRAIRAIEFADGKSESVGESRSRVFMHQAGLPKPQLQFEVRNRDGLVVATTDFGLPDHGVVGEFDGFVKYGRLLKPGEQPGDVVFREKRREDLIRDENYRVIRWTWQNLAEPEVLRSRFAHALERG